MRELPLVSKISTAPPSSQSHGGSYAYEGGYIRVLKGKVLVWQNG
jgi:hypothetical protein